MQAPKEARDDNLMNPHGMLTITAGTMMLFLSSVALSCDSLVAEIGTNVIPAILEAFIESL